MFGFLNGFYVPKKKKEEVKKESEREITGNDILNGTSPWKICNDKHGYYIGVFRFDENEWDYITNCSDQILGVTKKEFIKVLKEKYNFSISEDHYSRFSTFEDAKKAVDDFNPYYDDFYMPRAVMDRLSCYTEGGFPPYFIDVYKGPIYKEKKEK